MLLDEDTGRPITFTCEDCIGREPQVVPQIHPNGETITHINISNLQDADAQETRTFGEYDNRDQRKAINAAAQQTHADDLILKSNKEEESEQDSGEEQETE